MAKQRPPPRTRTSAKKPRAARRPPSRQTAPPPPPPTPPQFVAPPKRATFPEAVALYERGVEALQRRDFRAAADMLRAVIDTYPEERELHERGRLYLQICERETEPPQSSPHTPEERLYAATLALNAGRYGDALDQLHRVAAEDQNNDHVEYMLAVAYALRREPGPAVAHVRRAIELNPENRLLARQEADFDTIRDDQDLKQVLEIPAQAPRRRARRRAGR